MSYIELVIKLPEDEYQNILHTGKASFCAINAIEAGTPLPKEHGRLMMLSEDRLKEGLMNLAWSCQKWISEVDLSNAIVAIIEANKAEEEEYERSY